MQEHSLCFFFGNILPTRNPCIGADKGWLAPTIWAITKHAARRRCAEQIHDGIRQVTDLHPGELSLAAPPSPLDFPCFQSQNATRTFCDLRTCAWFVHHAEHGID